MYATYVLCREWPEAEPYIMQHPQSATTYARDVMKKRWLEAEPMIKKYDYWWCEYSESFRVPLNA
jgi:hypothetical protein